MLESNHPSGQLPDNVLSLIADRSVAPSWVSLIQQAYLAGRQLRRVLAQATARFHLCDSEFLVLWTCHRATPVGVPQGELTGLLCLSPAQLSSLVYDLRDRGLVQVERPATDRRRQLLWATDSGRDLITHVDHELTSLAVSLDAHFSLDDRRATTNLLERLICATTGSRDAGHRIDGASGTDVVRSLDSNSLPKAA